MELKKIKISNYIILMKLTKGYYVFIALLLLLIIVSFFYQSKMIKRIPVGIHYIIDIDDVENKELFKNEKILKLCEEILKVTKVTVLEKAVHEFKPQGITAMYLLAESHLSLHTWPELKKLRFDLFSCTMNGKFNEALEIIKQYFAGAEIDIKVIYR